MELAGVARTLRDAGVGEPAMARALQATTCAPEGGCTTEPPDDVVTGLTPDTRRALYDRLAAWPGNEFATAPFALPARNRDWWQAGADLPPALQSLVAKLTFEHDGFVFFADLMTVCRAARDDAERIAVVRTFWSMPSRMVWLRLDATSDIERIAGWWEHGQRRKSARVLLRSLVGADDEETLLDIVHLLPPVPRKVLYTYPPPGSPPRDCGWTSANFFEERVNDGYLVPAKVNAFLERHTAPVDDDERRFGDVVLFTTADGAIVHLAILLTPDLLFTKNGYTGFQPWRIVTLDELRREYAQATRILVRRPR